MYERHIGRYLVRLERKGNGFEYDVLSPAGLLVAAGFDLLSSTADEVFQKIGARYGG
jgi:hypothetical protein